MREKEASVGETYLLKGSVYVVVLALGVLVGYFIWGYNAESYQYIRTGTVMVYVVEESKGDIFELRGTSLTYAGNIKKEVRLIEQVLGPDRQLFDFEAMDKAGK